MNSLSKMRVQELNLLYSVLANLAEEHSATWTQLSQKDLFDLVTSTCKKKINPSLIQREIERLEQFQLPRNVDDQRLALDGEQR